MITPFLLAVNAYYYIATYCLTKRSYDYRMKGV